MSDVYTNLHYEFDPARMDIENARHGAQATLIAMIRRGELTATSLSRPDRRGYTVLHEMATRQRSVKAMLTEVLATGMDLNVRDNLGQAALHHAAYFDNLTVLKALLAAGADPNVRNDRGNTPLQVAFRSGREKTVRLLLAAGADPSARNRDGMQALDYEPPQGGAWRPALRDEIRRAIVDHEKAELEAMIAPADPTPTGPSAPRSRL